MSDIPKLCKWLRRFECRDRDGNYWSPQEILEAADVLERQEAENAKLLAEQYRLAEELKQLETAIEAKDVENARLTSILSGKTFPMEDPRVAELEAENAKLLELLKEVLACPASFSDVRIGYAERQVPIALFDEIRKAVSDE